MRYFDTYNKYTARALQGFKQIGTASHVQGKSHSFIFLKNDSTGECAIEIKHLTDSQVWIYSNKDEANKAYIEDFRLARA